MAASSALEQLLQYHRLLLAERRRRNPVGAFNREAAIAELSARLDGMGQRLRLDARIAASDPEENRRALDAWLRTYASSARR